MINNELKKLQKIIDEQKKAGIKVKYVFANELSRLPFLEEMKNKLETYEFWITDSKFLFLIYLDKNRRIKNGKIIYNDPHLLRFYEEFYEALFSVAKEP